jgi:hypothetical protein
VSVAGIRPADPASQPEGPAGADPARRARDERRLTLALFAVAWGANQFTPLLVVYRERFGFGPAVLGALWGCYAVGLVPGLLVGGAASDARGRRPVVLPFFFLSLLATGVLMAGAVWSPALALGRLVAGVVSGVVFGAGSAWLVELSAARHTRRAALAVTAGFCLGPLAAGLVADLLPWPAVVPYVPHLVLMAVALPGVMAAQETLRPGAHARRVPPSPRVRRLFHLAVAPVAPFVFGSVSVSFVVLPSRFGPLPHPTAVVGVLTGATLAIGAFVQPVARRLEAARPGRAALSGLGVAALGWTVAAWTARAPTLPGVLASLVFLGTAYALCLVCGLSGAGRLADDATRGTLVGWFYAWAYVGFAAPFVIAWLTRFVPMPWVLLGGAGLAAVSALVVRGALSSGQSPPG